MTKTPDKKINLNEPLPDASLEAVAQYIARNRNIMIAPARAAAISDAATGVKDNDLNIIETAAKRNPTGKANPTQAEVDLYNTQTTILAKTNEAIQKLRTERANGDRDEVAKRAADASREFKRLVAEKRSAGLSFEKANEAARNARPDLVAKMRAVPA